MRAGKKQSVLVSLLIVLSCSIVGVAGTPAKKPLSRETLVALLVGGAQAEAIVEHLHERGIAFNLTVEFKQQLKAAGANQFLLDALAKAQVSGPET
ncbi:MAG: hypothetical protein JO187_07310, partial [Acidobacteria bacterium]|nr:hypothetical protein [Acidobacteriota bacterium]